MPILFLNPKGEPLVGFEPTTPRLQITCSASLLYRAATTKYPCCVPTLGDSEGAGRTGLAHVFLKALQRYYNKLRIKN